MRDLANITKALADENRLRAFAAVMEQELCVCQITELLGLAPSTVSKHLSILKQAGVVDARKDGRWIYYRVASDNMSDPVVGAIAWVRDVLKSDPAWRAERKRLKSILNMDPEKLCRKQCGRC